MKYAYIILLSPLLLASTPKAETADGTAETTPSVDGKAVTVQMADVSRTKTVELNCGDDNQRSSQSFTEGVATFGDLPGGHCTLHFKGEIEATFTPVFAGKSYHCSIIGKTAVCKER